MSPCLYVFTLRTLLALSHTVVQTRAILTTFYWLYCCIFTDSAEQRRTAANKNVLLTFVLERWLGSSLDCSAPAPKVGSWV